MDRTQPLPAPAGYKWSVAETIFHNPGRKGPVFALELWRKDQVDGRPVVSEHFQKEKEIRKASKRALRALRDKLTYDELTRRVVGPR